MNTRSHWPLLALTVVACAPEQAPAPVSAPAIASRAPAAAPSASAVMAGAAEASLALPLGVPLGAYTGRLEMAHEAPDERDSPYCTEFEPSVGIQTHIPIKAVWLRTGQQDALLIKVDLAYSFDGILFDLHRSISQATGVDMTDKIVFATSHSHSSYGDFSDDVAMYLGTDQYNTEIAQRMVNQITSVAMNALSDLAPAAIGVGFDPNFDPIGVDRVFRDRRSENDDLVGPNGQVLGPGYKDPRLTVLRVDRTGGNTDPADDTPLALMFSFGIHGTVMGQDNALTTVESSGHMELKLQEQFDDRVVVFHMQGAAGDQSPAGRQDDFARMEYLGEYAAPRIYTLHQQIKTSADAVSVELLTRTIHQNRDEMHIRRQGTVDYFYTPYTPVYQGDDVIYDADGKVISPIDEFNTESGAALCTDDESMAIVGKLWGWGSDVAPYFTCANVSEVVDLMAKDIWDFNLDGVVTPLDTARSTTISTLRLGPVPIFSTTGGQTTDQVVFGFFPGEPVSLYSDTFRSSVEKVWGYKNVVTIGYAQDHEGYLLTLEDWLKGGYEPEINQWGPIQGEYILEQLVELVGQFGINNPAIPASSIPHPTYDYLALNPVVPDITVDAGTVPRRLPRYLYTFDEVMPTQTQPVAELSRLTGIAQFVWLGGDPAVDFPSVTLQRETSPGSDQWETVVHRSGRPWTSGPEVLVTWTPDPLHGTSDKTHYWTATFQAVNSDPGVAYSAGLPTGRYRFHVAGIARTEDGGSYPWPTTSYTLTSDAFTVNPLADVAVTAAYQGGTLNLTAAYPANDRGYRLISMDAENQKATNPLNAGGNAQPVVSVAIFDAAGVQVWSQSNVTFSSSTGISSGSVTPSALGAGTYSVRVTDLFGNSGRASLVVN